MPRQVDIEHTVVVGAVVFVVVDVVDQQLCATAIPKNFVVVGESSGFGRVVAGFSREPQHLVCIGVGWFHPGVHRYVTFVGVGIDRFHIPLDAVGSCQAVCG